MTQKLLGNSRLFLPSGYVGTACLAIGAIFKLLHLQGTVEVFQLGMLLFSVFGVWTLARVYFSKIDFQYKLLWMLGMIVAPVIVMWVYQIKNKMI
jgi:hypothetical protein